MSERPVSAALYDRAKSVMPGGNTRITVFMKPHLIMRPTERGAGSQMLTASNGWISQTITTHSSTGTRTPLSSQLCRRNFSGHRLPHGNRGGNPSCRIDV